MRTNGKSPRKTEALQIVYDKKSNSSFYFSGTHAAGAGVNPAGSTIHHCLNTSDIGLPSPVRATVRMGNLDAECNVLTTNFAFCHLSAPPYYGQDSYATLVSYQITRVKARTFFAEGRLFAKNFVKAGIMVYKQYRNWKKYGKVDCPAPKILI